MWSIFQPADGTSDIRTQQTTSINHQEAVLEQPVNSVCVLSDKMLRTEGNLSAVTDPQR